MFDRQDCFASLPAGYMDNAMFVLEIVKTTYSVSMVSVFQQLELENCMAFKIVKAS
jgi:hypothetical protein